MELTRPIAEDAAALTCIAHAAKRHWGYPDSRIAQWSAALAVTAEFSPTHPTVVARLNEQPVGFAALTGLGRQLRLEHLWVLPEFMRQGVGRTLVVEISRLGRAVGWATVQIVSELNAEGFYLRLGAKRTSEETSGLDGHRRALSSRW